MLGALEKFSQTNLNYIAGFVVNVAICLFLLLRGLTLESSQLILSALFVVTGFVYYGLLEYLIHRWIFHGKWLSNANVFSRGHALHHEDMLLPIAQPFFLQVFIGLVHWVVIARFMPAYLVYFWLFGFFSAYLYYGVLHHAMHLGTHFKSRYFRHLAAYHTVHHKHPNSNFGVSSRIWDLLFGTGYRRSDQS